MTLGMLSGCNGCHEEPTIVIRFEPSDAAGLAQVKPSPTPTPSIPASPSPSPAAKPKTATKECKTAADCVVMPEECCDCANGGRQHAIAKKTLAAARAARAESCKHTMCTMMLSTDPTCGMRADCVAGACEMVKKEPKAK